MLHLSLGHGVRLGLLPVRRSCRLRKDPCLREAVRETEARRLDPDSRLAVSAGLGWWAAFGPARLGGMALTILGFALLAALGLAASILVAARATDVRGYHDAKSGPIAPARESGTDVQIVTIETVPGRKCAALARSGGYFPVMVLPTLGALVGRTLADGAIPWMKSLREAALEEGVSVVLGLRGSPYITRNGNPRMFLCGTPALCE